MERADLEPGQVDGCWETGNAKNAGEMEKGKGKSSKSGIRGCSSNLSRLGWRHTSGTDKRSRHELGQGTGGAPLTAPPSSEPLPVRQYSIPYRCEIPMSPKNTSPSTPTSTPSDRQLHTRRIKRGIYRTRCNATPQERIDARVYMTTKHRRRRPPSAPFPVLLEKQLLR